MIVSKKGYIYLANPKTATKSIQKTLVDFDPDAKKCIVNVNGKERRFKGHITAKELKKEMGNDYDKFIKFAFVREPVSKLISSYFFYRNGKPIMENNKSPWPPRLRIFLAKLLPFSIWAIVYPYKSNLNHLVNDEGKLLIDYVGKFESLDIDLRLILAEMGVDLNLPELPHVNTSSHKSTTKYLRSPLLRWIVLKKLEKDIQFYENVAVKNGIYINS